MLFAFDICVNKKTPPTHSVHWGLRPPLSLQKHNPFFFFFFAKPALKSSNYPSPPFQAIHPLSKKTCFFMNPHVQKNQKTKTKKPRIFQLTLIILEFFIISPSHLLKVAKLLVEISQFKFLVVTEKNIFIFKFFCH